MTEPGTIAHKQVPEPSRPGDHEVMLRIKRIGVCGSDIHVYHGEHPATSYPVVQGHEFSATVEEVGSKVSGISRGMRATARPQLVCGSCGPCRKGRYNVCQNLRVQGFQADGVAQDLFVVPEDRLVVFPDQVGLDEGAMIEPLAVGVHATGRVGSLEGKNVMVSGAGTIGNLVAQMAKARGAGKVLITDVSDYRLEMARKCGLENTFNVKKGSLKDMLQSCFGEEGFQVGFDAAGTEGALNDLMQFAEKGSDIVVLGVYAENPRVNMYYLGEHELSLIGSMMYRHEDYLDAVEYITAGKVILKPLISTRFPFEKYAEAYRFIEEQKDRYLKVIIDVNSD